MLLHDANNGKKNWVYNIKNLICSLGYSKCWYNQNPNFINFNILIQRLHDQYIQQWQKSVHRQSKLRLYKHVKTSFIMEFYVNFLFQSHSSLLAQIRSSCLNLNVETGRYQSFDRHFRLCQCCNMNITEDEYHFVLVCFL